MKSYPKTLLKRMLDKLLGNLLSAFPGARLVQYLPRGYNHVLDIVAAEHSSKDFLVIDVGANTGQSARFYLRHLRSPKIHSFEPVSQTYAQLLAFSEKARNVDVYHAALGATAGETEIQVSGESLNNSLIPEVHSQLTTEKYEQIRIMTLDQFCIEKQISCIDILKIDTEGFELEVLKGAEGLLRRKAIAYIYCEAGFNDEVDKVRFYRINDHLRPHGFRFGGLYEATRTGKGHSCIHYANALFVRITTES